LEKTIKTFIVFLTVKDIKAALLKVNGLRVLERNILQLKKNNFEVIVLASKELISSLSDLCDRLNVVLNDSFDCLDDENNYLSVQGDVQYSLSFFAEIQKIISNKYYLNWIFESSDRMIFPVHWMCSESSQSKKEVLYHSSFVDVSNLLNRYDENKAQSLLSDQFFDEIYKNSEGWITKSINKKISFPITKYLVKTNLTPNMITLAALLIGLIGCLMLISSSWSVRIFGALLLQFNSIIDGCDGEVARLKVASSKVGAWFDTISDDVLNNMMFVCLYVGLFQQYPNLLFLKACLLSTGASLGLSFFLYHYMITHKTPNASHFRLAWARGYESTKFDLVKPILKRDFIIFLVLVFVAIDLRFVLFVLFIPIWIGFFLYLASFIYQTKQIKSLAESRS